MFKKLPKKLIGIPIFVVLWLVSNLFQDWILTTTKNLLNSWGAPMSILNFVEQYQYFVIPIIAIVGIAVIVLLSYRDNERRRNNETNEYIRRKIFDAKSEKVLNIIDTITEITQRHKYLRINSSHKNLSLNEIAVLLKKMFDELKLKISPFNHSKSAKKIVKEESTKNAKKLGLTTNKSFTEFSEQDIRFMMKFYYVFGDANVGIMPLLNDESYIELNNKLENQIANISVMAGAKVYKHINISLGINNFILIYEIAPKTIRDIYDNFFDFRISELKDAVHVYLTESSQNIRGMIENELYLRK